MKFNELFRRLEKAGCHIIRRCGKHDVWYSPITGLTCTLGRHGANEVPPRELNAAQKYLLGQ